MSTQHQDLSQHACTHQHLIAKQLLGASLVLLAVECLEGFWSWAQYLFRDPQREAASWQQQSIVYDFHYDATGLFQTVE